MLRDVASLRPLLARVALFLFRLFLRLLEPDLTEGLPASYPSSSARSKAALPPLRVVLGFDSRRVASDHES
jgi:hypothetical protein